ncbi:MAG TPA: methyltransferase domain-containing protein [Chloroflexota bacterium]
MRHSIQPRRLLRSLGDRAFDRLLGVETSAEVSTRELGFDDARRCLYIPTSWLAAFEVRRILAGLRVTPADVFADLGSGKGRVVCLAAAFPFGRVIGVEVSPRLSELARQNVARLGAARKCGQIELETCDLAEYPVPDDLTVAYLNNPVVGAPFAAAVENLRASVARRPRVLVIIYHNPVEHDLLVANGFRVVRDGQSTRVYVAPPG